MSDVIFKKEGHSIYISLNRPENLNAINRKMARELGKIWENFRDDDDLWVAILGGEGKSFCAGVNVKEYELGEWDFHKSYVIGDDLLGPWDYKVWKPVIGALHKHVYGVGVWLALQCDIRIAADDVLLGMPEPKINIPTLFAPFLMDFLPRGIGTELLLTGDPINAHRAYEIGLVNKVVPREHLIPEVKGIAEKICENGPLSIRGMKEMIWNSYNMDYQNTIALIKNVATPICNAEDSVEAKRAFIEKRKPQWRCR